MHDVIGRLASLVIGSVEAVSPDEILVSLDLEAPHVTALNSGSPTAFPKINGYALVPSQVGAVVGLITWIGIAKSVFPRRTGLRDFGVLDLPFPVRKMKLAPLGMLRGRARLSDLSGSHRLTRGVEVFPSVGDPVTLPTDEQIVAIIAGGSEERRVRIGVAPLGAKTPIAIDPDRLFGRHLAVLGNTGSGKSCSVAGLIRWCYSETVKVRRASKRSATPNARFIILDPNGEYSHAFRDLGSKVQVVAAPPVTGRTRQLTVPAWVWNSHEWVAFTGAAPGTQRPLLLRALRELRAGGALQPPIELQAYRILKIWQSRLQATLNDGAFAGFPQREDCAASLNSCAIDCIKYASSTTGQLSGALAGVAEASKTAIAAREFTIGSGDKRHRDFAGTDIQEVLDRIAMAIAEVPPGNQAQPASEDAPIPFNPSLLPDYLDKLAADHGAQVSQFVQTLSMRIRMMLADRRLGPIVDPAGANNFVEWLESYVGRVASAPKSPITIIDLSLVPSDVLHIAIAVLARVTFEATQRYHRHHGKSLPTVLVLEEAHTFVRRTTDEQDSGSSPSSLCRQTFERIAREGRKFGLGLVLSSQRPSELSPTVLAQCNTFLLHRIVNDSDQALVRRLVPDNLGGLLRELSSLPSRQALLLGWAAPIPVLLEVDELREEHRPQSADPAFWRVWTGDERRSGDWETIVEEWTQ